MIGEINGGWTVAKALLGHERSMIANIFGGRRRQGPRRAIRAALAALAREHGWVKRPGALADPVLRDEIAQSEMDTRPSSSRCSAAATPPRRATSRARELAVQGLRHRAQQAPHELMVRIAGPQALGWEGPGFDDDELELTRDWLRARGNSIEGGTSEIQLNIIAKRVLGLPD